MLTIYSSSEKAAVTIGKVMACLLSVKKTQVAV